MYSLRIYSERMSGDRWSDGRIAGSGEPETDSRRLEPPHVQLLGEITPHKPTISCPSNSHLGSRTQVSATTVLSASNAVFLRIKTGHGHRRSRNGLRHSPWQRASLRWQWRRRRGVSRQRDVSPSFGPETKMTLNRELLLSVLMHFRYSVSHLATLCSRRHRELLPFADTVATDLTT